MAARVLVTAALPYANGSIHLGHMLEFIQTDVYVRARKLAGEDVVFMWADDTHGTPIQLRAQREGITPEALIERAAEVHAAGNNFLARNLVEGVLEFYPELDDARALLNSWTRTPEG